MKTAVLVHGHHLGTTEWEWVEWGNPAEGVYGNIPKGLVEALRFDAETIIFGTGASEKDGLTEGEYALSVATARIGDISEFKDWGESKAREWLMERAVTEKTATNTSTEILAGARIARNRGAERLIQVACRTHSARAHNTALCILRDEPELRFFLPNFYTIASDTSYDDADARDVVIIEPPHRPDGPMVAFNTTLQALVPLMNSPRAPELNEAIARVIEEHQKNL